MDHEKIGQVTNEVKEIFNIVLEASDIKVNKEGMRSYMMKRHHNDVIQHIEDLELILSNPDFVEINPREKGASFEYVKRFDDNVLVAIKLHKSGDFFYVPTMYRIQDYKLQSRIKSGRLRKIDKKSR
ncbi:hypothetical protein [Streptococcus infantis]|uniref:PBECR3 domain-containing polyvalent protein n=1 Tax=Streptococcus infantis TaxID=68892 RepID=UPI0039C4940E